MPPCLSIWTRNCSSDIFGAPEVGPSGMTNEHLRPLLDDWASMQVLFKAGEVFARGSDP